MNNLPLLSKNKKNLNDLKRIDPIVFKDIIRIIHDNGSIRKTPLMGKTNLSYLRLNSYLNWLEEIGFVHVQNNHVVLSEHGLKFSSKFAN
ncbi:MAG: hypothetical protein J4F36_10840 [Nitrosopumilaceae archaeon]|nr:hypothetical protein [Nitrosopumilaceae archaeon]